MLINIINKIITDTVKRNNATAMLTRVWSNVHIPPVSVISNSFQTTKHGIVDPMLSIWGHQLFVNGDTDQ